MIRSVRPLAALALCLTALFCSAPAVAQGAAGSRTAAPPLFHGHWCGAGDQNRAAPVDALDAACRAHDLCYERVGRNACNCDRAFLDATARLARNMRIPESVRSKAATANSLFSAAPCRENPELPKKTGAP
ncbi:phospholipase A2 family protein [Microvirga subterranea]|uniref:phospholipase A2 family protein n=1 Tax=Microvirga subterranea TaxID=186651 RepID=UPI001474684F|nr:phospholipase A2 family protein [Microvirga subterranea]